MPSSSPTSPDPSPLCSREPATGAVLWQGEAGDLDAAVTAARAALPHWASQPHAKRADLLRHFAGEIRRQSEAFADMIARETGRPLWDVRGEVDQALAGCDAAMRAYGERCVQRKFDGGVNGTLALRHKPLGVMAVITPFAQPLATPLARLVPALLAGNTVLLKPSVKALATTMLLVDCAARAGLPAGVVQCLAGDGAMAQALALHDGVDGVLFAGSAAAGQALARKLVARPEKLLALDLGGNNALVVWDTPQIEEAALIVVQSAFSASGQRATCARRLIVKDTLAQPLLAAVKRLADRIICGAPHDEPTPFMGPVCDNETADALVESFIWLMSNGGRVVKHMQRLSREHPFLSPAIIDVTTMTQRPDVELFGPLLQVIRVATFDEAIAQANATRYGLVAGLIGGTQAEYDRFWAHSRAGLVHWNRPTITEIPNAPMGGVGLSGNFRTGGTYMIDSCTYPVASLENEVLRATIGTGFAAQELE